MVPLNGVSENLACEPGGSKELCRTNTWQYVSNKVHEAARPLSTRALVSLLILAYDFY